MSIPDATLIAIRSRLDAPQVAGWYGLELKTDGPERFKARCPFHKEKTASFTVYKGGGFKCYGCSASGDAIGLYQRLSGEDFPTAIRSIAERLGVPTTVSGGRGEHTSGRSPTIGNWQASAPTPAKLHHHKLGEPSQAWEVRDREGRLFAVHCQFNVPNGKKTFRWWRNNKWSLGGLGSSDAPLYASERLPGYDQSRPVFLCEGEKATDALLSVGLQVLGTATGASTKPSEHVFAVLRGYDVVMWPDSDHGGFEHMEELRRISAAVAKKVQLFVPDGPLEKGDDAFDFVEMRLQAETSPQVIALELEKAAAALPEWRHGEDGRGDEMGNRPTQADASRVDGQKTAEQTQGSPREFKLDPLDEAQKQNTHRANAWRIARRHGHELRHSPGLGFLIFDGRRWRRSDSEALRIAARVSRYVCEEAAEFSKRASRTEDKDRRKGLEETAEMLNRWARSSEQGNAIRESLKLTAPLVRLEATTLDAHEYLLNVENGTIDLRDGKRRSHDSADLLTKQAPVRHRGDAEAQRWQAFIKDIMGGRERLVRYLQKALGYSLTGLVKEQCLFFAYGTGQNGKTTLLEAVRETLGPDYVTKAAPDLLIASRFSRPHPSEIADLRGARLVISQEVAGDKAFDSQKMKDLTGERWQKGRHMHQDWFEFPATFKIWLAANHRPRTRDNTPAFWRRIRLIPFTQRIANPDKDLGKKLVAEKSGILNWLLDGVRLYLDEGLEAPPEVTEAVEEYRLESDSLGQFIAECCQTDPGLEVKVAELWKAYEAYATEHDLHMIKKGDLRMAMLDGGFRRPPRRGTGYYYRGLALKPAGVRATDDDRRPGERVH